MPESTPPPTDDLIRPFQIDPFALRGRLARLGPALDAIIGRHGYPDAAAGMLGEALALAAILAGALKYEGVFTLQIKGDGAIRLLVADVTSAGALRGYVQFDASALETAAAHPVAPVPRLFGSGYLAFTVDQGEHTERYQGIVELEGATLADCVHHYFRQSEQIEAGIRVAAARRPDGTWRAGGIMIQRLPAEGGHEAESRLAFDGDPADDRQEDGWLRALTLLGSCTDAELTDPALGNDALLFRLFHEDGIRVYPPHRLEDRCRCSRTRIESALRSLAEGDTADLATDGKIVVTCEFCSKPYEFDAEELARVPL